MEMRVVEKVLLGLVIAYSLSEGWWSCDCCLDDERNALLQLKAFMNDPSAISISAWGEDSDDCCAWANIICNSTSGRVSELNIWGINKGQYLNISLFLSFQELTVLRFQQNSMIDWVENEGFEKFARLNKLEILHLSENQFKNKSIISFVGHLPSLKSLSLAYMGLQNATDLQGLSKLGSLEILDLSYNELGNGILPTLSHLSSLKKLYLRSCKLRGTVDIQKLDAMGNLEEMDIGGNQITRVVSSRDVGIMIRNLSGLFIDDNEGSNIRLELLGSYPFLKTLSLKNNSFKGAIFAQEMGNLTRVTKLYLDDSSIDEEAFMSLGALPSLKYLFMVSVNALATTQGLPNLKYLEHLDLRGSTLHHNVLNDIEKMPSLKILLLSNCELSGIIPAIKGLCELKHLRQLDLSLNNFNGMLPSCLANLTSLQLLDLSSNLFQIPISLLPFFNHSKLKHLDCHDNEIYEDIDVPNLIPKFQLETLDLSGQGHGGAFPKFLHHQKYLQFVDMSNVRMKGEFPYWLIANNTNLGTFYLANCSLLGPVIQLPVDSHENLSDLDISRNYFNGPIPAEIGICFPSLKSLNLSKAGLVGSIPSSFGNMVELVILDLSNNRLSGMIPQDMTVGCVNLKVLILSNNDLKGQIFPKQADCGELVILQLDGNQFTGSITSSMRNCTRLDMLDASDNHLFGRIPSWIRNITFLEVLDLSMNSLFGNLPASIGPMWIREVYLSTNMLRGPLRNAFGNCSKLLILDLSHNYFTGKIPKWISEFPKLSYLLLGYNKLEGQIPIQLCNLSQLSLVDLSNNNLYGHVLPCIKAAGNRVKQEEEFLNLNVDASQTYMKQPLLFTAKSAMYYFQGIVLKYISGLDLSCNKLTGQIPIEIGNLSMIQVLNLSHNNLIGSIPQSFSNLKQIESLDLSYNNLNGKIPQLTRLNFLEVFSVAHNNLSGKTPEMVGQFATFDNSSYEGNYFLCGPPLLKSCFPSPVMPTEENKEDGGLVDMDAFYVSFLISYGIVLFTIVVALYINPYWRRVWFYMIELTLTNFYYFLVDHIPFVFRCY